MGMGAGVGSFATERGSSASSLHTALGPPCTLRLSLTLTLTLTHSTTAPKAYGRPLPRDPLPLPAPLSPQAAAGLVAHHLSETLPTSLTGLSGWLSGSSTAAATSSGDSSGSGSPAGPTTTPFQRIASAPGRELLNRVNESLATFQQVGMVGGAG